MHQPQHVVHHGTTTRIAVGAAVAVTIAVVAVISTAGIMEALCATLTDSDPLWHLLACWMYPSPPSPIGG